MSSCEISIKIRNINYAYELISASETTGFLSDNELNSSIQECTPTSPSGKNRFQTFQFNWFISVSLFISSSKNRINLNLASKGTLNYLSCEAKANLQLAWCIELVLIFFKLTQSSTNKRENYSMMHFLATD